MVKAFDALRAFLFFSFSQPEYNKCVCVTDKQIVFKTVVFRSPNKLSDCCIVTSVTVFNFKTDQKVIFLSQDRKTYH